MLLTRKRYVKPMKRLAGYMGFELEYHGRAGYVLLAPNTDKKILAPQNVEDCLGTLISLATSPESWGGWGMSYAEVSNVADLNYPSKAIKQTYWQSIEIAKMCKHEPVNPVPAKDIPEVRIIDARPKDEEVETKPTETKPVKKPDRFCKKCGDKLPVQTGRGRPRIYCKGGCKKKAA